LAAKYLLPAAYSNPVGDQLRRNEKQLITLTPSIITPLERVSTSLMMGSSTPET
jgi:hypothetical protein